MPTRGSDNLLGIGRPLGGESRPSRGVGGPPSGGGGFIVCLSMFPSKVPLGTHGAHRGIHHWHPLPMWLFH
jgi:hypothetical protein